MQLNELSPAPGSTKARKRVGRGIGSGSGKTCGTGHKGQKSRSGGTVRPGFEGGQMPLQRRLPKYGFSSRIGRVSAEIRTSELNKLDADVIDIEVLRKANLITATIKRVKVMLSGDISRPITLQAIGVTKGARTAIEAAGGKIIEAEPAKTGKLKKKVVTKVVAEKPAKKKSAKAKVEKPEAKAAIVEEKPAEPTETPAADE
jgi:large subunit ribosomal protein L15